MVRRFKGELFLSITAIIWGLSFVSQKLGMTYLGPFSFSASRLLLGSFVLVPVFFILGRRSPQRGESSIKELLIGGGICGLLIFGGIGMQQVGLQYTTAGKSAFITALYIVIVPFLGIFFKKKISHFAWVGVFIAIIGLYLLTIKNGFSMQKGDMLCFIGSFFWAVHIIFVGHYANRVNGIKLSALQFFVAGVLSLIVAIVLEDIQFSNVLLSYKTILFSGVIVVGVAYTLQVIGQKTVEPSLSAMILSLEAVFATLAGMLFLSETMTSREVLGCILMFIAIILAQKKGENERI